MERTLDVPTAESVELRYELAGIGSRFLALSIDVSIQFGIAAVAVVLIATFAPPLVAAVPRSGPAASASAVAIALVVIAAFALFFGYFIIFELVWNGRTPGKRALGLRAVRVEGFPLDIGAAVIRNVVRLLEAALGLYVVSALVVLRSPRNQRIGDYAAGTIVVRDRRADAGILDVLAAAANERDDGLSATDRELVARFLMRRGDLDPASRGTLAAAIAARVRPKLAASFAHIDDESLLEHVGRP